MSTIEEIRAVMEQLHDRLQKLEAENRELRARVNLQERTVQQNQRDITVLYQRHSAPYVAPVPPRPRVPEPMGPLTFGAPAATVANAHGATPTVPSFRLTTPRDTGRSPGSLGFGSSS